MKPRILFLDHSGALGGAELYLQDVVRPYRDIATVAVFENGPFVDRLRADGIDTVVVTGGASGGLQSVQKSSSLTDALRALPALVRLIGRLLPLVRHHDLVFANSQKALIVGAVATALAQRPLVWNLHDMLTADHFSRLNRWVAVTCANGFADRVIVNSHATRRAFAASGGDAGKTGLVYNGIDASPFDRVTDEDVDRVRAALALPDAPLVGIFSRLATWKGQHVAIEALPALPDVHLLLVGEALFSGDQTYTAHLQALAQRLQVADRVHFLGFRDDVPILMKAVDVVAHTSTAPEPFGRVVVEGMLAGRPVIATRAGGPQEIIEDGRTGQLVAPGDPDALAHALRALLRRPGAAATLARRGQAAARARFSVANMHRRMHSNLVRVLDLAPLNL